MSDERLAALLSELLSDDDDFLERDGSNAEMTQAGINLGTEIELFNQAELEAALSSLPQEGNSADEETEARTPSLSHSSKTYQPDVAQTTTESSSLDHNRKTDIDVEPQDPGSIRTHDPKTEKILQSKRFPELYTEQSSLAKLLTEDIFREATALADRIRKRLLKSEDSWNKQGRPDAEGGMVGGRVALRYFNGTEPIAGSLQNEARYGTPIVICARQIRNQIEATAIATSRGLILIQTKSAGSTPEADPVFEVFELADQRSVGTPTAMSFSHCTEEKDKLLLAIANNEGMIHIWDVINKKSVAVITGHSGFVTCIDFLKGRSGDLLISADSKGALSQHVLTSWVVRTSVYTKILSEGNGQPVVFDFFPVDASVSKSDENPRIGYGEGFVCLCHPNMSSIGRLSPDGRLTILYQIPKPAVMDKDVMPISLWLPLSEEITYAVHPRREIGIENFRNLIWTRLVSDGRIPCCTLALCWDTQLTLLKVPLIGDMRPVNPDARQQINQLEVADLFRLAHEIHITSSAFWKSEDEHGPILYICSMPDGRVGVIRQHGVLCQFVLLDKDLSVLDQVDIDDCPISRDLRKDPTALVSLHNTASATGRLVTMIGTLSLKQCKLLEWKETVNLLVGIEKFTMALHLLLAFFCQATHQQYCPEVGMAQTGERKVDKIDKYISEVCLSYLDHTLNKIGSIEEGDLVDVTDLVFDILVYTDQSQVLFDDVYPRFVDKQMIKFALEKIERSLTSNELKIGLPPEVMQSLVEYCCEIGQPDKVERCVLKMDISSIDLNQVIPLCIDHNLFTALLFIYNNSLLRDCITPAVHLVNATLLSEDKTETETLGKKLLFYLDCCLSGDSFPPGMETIDEEQALRTKQQVPPVKLDRYKWKQVLGFIVFTTADDLKRSLKSKSIFGRNPENFENAATKLTDPYPVLRCVLSIEQALVLQMLQSAFDSWDCMEKDLLEAYSRKSVEEMTKVRTASQVFVDALIDLMQSCSSDKGIWFDYICQSVASGRAVINTSVAMSLLEHLASKRQEASVYASSEEEDRFCGIVKSAGVELDPSKQGLTKMTILECKKALGLALNANYLVAAAYVHHMLQEYKSAIECYIKAGDIASGGFFSYFEESVSHFTDYKFLYQLNRLKEAALDCMKDLAAMNPEKAASLVLKHFPDDQEAVIQALQGSRDLQFKYLRSSMESTLANTEVSLAENSNQLLTRDHCTLYVNLMCEFDPDGVLPFLKSCDHLVNVQQCKQDCLKFGLLDGAAHLLEREGDIFGALEVITTKIEKSNASMEKGILSRSVDSIATTLSRQLSLSAILRVTISPDHRLNQLPHEVKEAQSALSAAVMLCRRNSVEKGRGDIDEKRRKEILDLWYSLIKVYIGALSQLPEYLKRSKKPNRSVSSLYQKGVDKMTDQFEEYPRLAFIRDIYAALLDEVVAASADYLSLMEVAEVIISEHGSENFGSFRSVLLSLINAYNYEQNILTLISRLLSADAYRVLLSCYKKRSEALQIAKTDFPLD